MSRAAKGLIRLHLRIPIKAKTPAERAFYRRALRTQHALRTRDARAAYQAEQLHKAQTARRLALYGTTVNRLTLKQWGEIQARYQYRCAYCQQEKPLTQDHIVPVSKGGFHTHINVIPACRSCNSSKGNRPARLYKPTLIPF